MLIFSIVTSSASIQAGLGEEEGASSSDMFIMGGMIFAWIVGIGYVAVERGTFSPLAERLRSARDSLLGRSNPLDDTDVPGTGRDTHAARGRFRYAEPEPAQWLRNAASTGAHGHLRGGDSESKEDGDADESAEAAAIRAVRERAEEAAEEAREERARKEAELDQIQAEAETLLRTLFSQSPGHVSTHIRPTIEILISAENAELFQQYFERAAILFPTHRDEIRRIAADLLALHYEAIAYANAREQIRARAEITEISEVEERSKAVSSLLNTYRQAFVDNFRSSLTRFVNIEGTLFGDGGAAGAEGLANGGAGGAGGPAAEGPRYVVEIENTANPAVLSEDEQENFELWMQQVRTVGMRAAMGALPRPTNNTGMKGVKGRGFNYIVKGKPNPGTLHHLKLSTAAVTLVEQDTLHA